MLPAGETLQEVEGSKRCIWPSRCHCHSLSLAPVNPDWFYLPGFYFSGTCSVLTRVVPDKFQKSSKTVVCVCVTGSKTVFTTLVRKQTHFNSLMLRAISE